MNYTLNLTKQTCTCPTPPPVYYLRHTNGCSYYKNIVGQVVIPIDWAAYFAMDPLTRPPLEGNNCCIICQGANFVGNGGSDYVVDTFAIPVITLPNCP